MSGNLEYQYDQVVSYIEGYTIFQTPIMRRWILSRENPFQGLTRGDFLRPWRVVWRVIRVYLWIFKFSWSLVGQYRKLNPLSGRSLDLNRTLISNNATEDEKKNPYSNIAVSEYPLDALSESVKQKCTNVDSSGLKELHELRMTQLSRFNAKQLLGIVLAAAAMILQLAPKAVIRGVFGVEYATFQIWVFWGTVIVFLYLLIAVLPGWWKHHKARRSHAFVGDVIVNVCIKEQNT